MKLTKAYVRRRLHEECEKDRAEKRLRSAAHALLAAAEATIKHCQPPALKAEEVTRAPSRAILEQLRAAIALARDGK